MCKRKSDGKEIVRNIVTWLININGSSRVLICGCTVSCIIAICKFSPEYMKDEREGEFLFLSALVIPLCISVVVLSRGLIASTYKPNINEDLQLAPRNVILDKLLCNACHFCSGFFYVNFYIKVTLCQRKFSYNQKTISSSIFFKRLNTKYVLFPFFCLFFFYFESIVICCIAQ